MDSIALPVSGDANSTPISSAVPSQSRRRNPRNQQRSPRIAEDGTPLPSGSQPRPPRTRRKPPSSNEASTSTTGPSNNNPRPKNTRQQPTSSTEKPPRPTAQPKAEGNRRKANFGAGLTQGDTSSTTNKPTDNRRPKQNSNSSSPESSTAPPRKPQEKRQPKRLPQGDDLTSRLIRELSTPPYPDCPICFSAIRPDQAIWSCSPSAPIVTSSGTQIQQYCWSSFHIKCIRSWADKSVKEVAEAWRARGEPDKKGDWRCPGCQAKREVVPSGYWCFCHSTSEPKPPRLSTPHSCANSCTRPRESGCGHPCPLQCHPGPCPPCQVTTRLECYCPKKNILTFRCGVDARQGTRNLSCGKVCGRTLGCGKHTCEKTCHEGPCDDCQIMETAKCWCGKEQRQVVCASGDPIECFVEGEQPWIGRFGCDEVCDRSFDCGIHHCQKSCHPPSSKPATCPRSPSKINHCPCGQHTIAPTPSSDASQYTFPARTSCTDPIPTCTSICSKPHAVCSHVCAAPCHTGPCPPCMVKIVRPCRCGATTKSMACHEVHLASAAGTEEKEILCDKPCQALRACGSHRCNRICCPLASLGMSNKKGKRRGAVVVDDSLGIGEEQGGLHECDLVCGKLLSCGNHRCERREHRGACPPCLQSSFEELICPCGRTIYEPPNPCGTRMECHYPCSRPPPACGHPNTPHSCHADTTPCPPCVHLATKQCACGKKFVPNVRCSLETEKVSCGTICGKLMTCGFHHCQRLCHGDECGSCTAPCGKERKSCLPNHHLCTRPCHAPSACPETDPCESLITLTCPCGRIRQSVHCGKSVSSRGAESTQPPIKCTTECQIAKRNAKLADALGINPESQGKTGATYGEEVVGFARVNSKFLGVVEKAFADFVTSEKRTQVLPHMPPDRRKFVHDLAAVYRIDTQMIDQEPNRSVQLLRRLDTRIPSPLLSTYITSIAPTPSLGKLADFRSLRGTQSPGASWRSGPPSTMAAGSSRPTSTSAGSTPRGWTSVVARPTAASTATGMGIAGSTTMAAPRPTATLAGMSAGTLAARHAVSTSGSAAHTRASSPAASHLHNTASPAVGPPIERVPDNWEDDV